MTGETLTAIGGHEVVLTRILVVRLVHLLADRLKRSVCLVADCTVGRYRLDHAVVVFHVIEVVAVMSG